jgi:hypothetical protein
MNGPTKFIENKAVLAFPGRWVFWIRIHGGCDHGQSGIESRIITSIWVIEDVKKFLRVVTQRKHWFCSPFALLLVCLVLYRNRQVKIASKMSSSAGKPNTPIPRSPQRVHSHECIPGGRRASSEVAKASAKEEWWTAAGWTIVNA